MPALVSLALLGRSLLVGGSRNRDLGGIVRLGGQHEGVCVSTPAAISMLRSAETKRTMYRKSSTAMFRGQVGSCMSLQPWAQMKFWWRELYVTRGALGS